MAEGGLLLEARLIGNGCTAIQCFGEIAARTIHSALQHQLLPDLVFGRDNDNAQWSRPLCDYPRLAIYKGTGTRTDAANWSCIGF